MTKRKKKGTWKGKGRTRRRNNSDAQALAEYKATHWGDSGNAAITELPCPDPAAGTLVELGELVCVVYRTVKGGDGLCDYFHDFGHVRPRLCFNDDKGLIVAGGDYTVTERGIEG